MTEFTDMLERLSRIDETLLHIEKLMRERLPVPLPADSCASCGKALDHFGTSPYCSACLERFGAEIRSG